MAAKHARVVARGGNSIVLDQYLEVLVLDQYLEVLKSNPSGARLDRPGPGTSM